MVLVFCTSSHHVRSKFKFNPCCTFMTRTSNHYEKNDYSVNKQGMIMIIVNCPSSHCHLSINQVSFQTHFVFSKIWHGHASIEKNKWLRGDNSLNKHVRIMVLVFCPSPHCRLSIKFHLNVNSILKLICRTRCRMDGRTKRSTICFRLCGSITKQTSALGLSLFLHHIPLQSLTYDHTLTSLWRSFHVCNSSHYELVM